MNTGQLSVPPSTYKVEVSCIRMDYKVFPFRSCSSGWPANAHGRYDEEFGKIGVSARKAAEARVARASLTVQAF